MSGPWTQAASMVFDPYNVVVMLGASLFGLFVGAMPGLTATMATALLVPVTFFMAPIPAIAAIVTATAMAIFAGDIAQDEARAVLAEMVSELFPN